MSARETEPSPATAVPQAAFVTASLPNGAGARARKTASQDARSLFLGVWFF